MRKTSFTGVRATSDPDGSHELSERHKAMIHIWALSPDGCNRRRSWQGTFLHEGESPDGLMYFPDGIASKSPPGRESSTCRSCVDQTVSGQTHSWGSGWWQVGPVGRLTHCTTKPIQEFTARIEESLGTSLCETQRGVRVNCAWRGRCGCHPLGLEGVRLLKHSDTPAAPHAQETYTTHDTRQLLHRTHTLRRQHKLAMQPHAGSHPLPSFPSSALLFFFLFSLLFLPLLSPTTSLPHFFLTPRDNTCSIGYVQNSTFSLLFPSTPLPRHLLSPPLPQPPAEKPSSRETPLPNTPSPEETLFPSHRAHSPRERTRERPHPREETPRRPFFVAHTRT